VPHSARGLGEKLNLFVDEGANDLPGLGPMPVSSDSNVHQAKDWAMRRARRAKLLSKLKAEEGMLDISTVSPITQWEMCDFPVLRRRKRQEGPRRCLKPGCSEQAALPISHFCCPGHEPMWYDRPSLLPLPHPRPPMNQNRRAKKKKKRGLKRQALAQLAWV